MTLEELKQYKDGVCLGYSTIGYLLKNVYPFNSTEPDEVRHISLRYYKQYSDSKVYPIIIYYKNTDGNEGILCRPMTYSNNLFSPIGMLHHKLDNDKYERMTYVAKTEKMPLDIDIDSIFEYKREPIPVKG